MSSSKERLKFGFNNSNSRKMNVTLKIVGAEDIAKKLQTFGEIDLKNARDKWLKESAILLEWEAKKEAPVDKGILRKYIRSKINEDHAIVYNNISYALYVHEGTKAHIIKPKEKRGLFWKGLPHPVKSVRHPWTKANPFFNRALSNSETRIQKRFSEIINTLITTRFWW